MIGAYNSTQHFTTGSSADKRLTGHEKALPMTFFYPEFEVKKTSPQVYLRDVIRCQQDLIHLCNGARKKRQQGRERRLTRKQLGQKLTQ